MTLPKFANYSEAYLNHYYLGYCAISFRYDSPNRDSHRAFVLNCLGDGWFRRDHHSNIPGLGICIKSVKITSKKPHLMGDFICYKAKIEWINSSFYNEGEVETDKVWIYVHKHYEIKDVLKYIEDNNHEWRP